MCWWNWIWSSYSDLTPIGSVLEGKSPAISGKSRLVKYDNLGRLDFMDFIEIFKAKAPIATEKMRISHKLNVKLRAAFSSSDKHVMSQ